ncbi:Tol-Pal system beta propeller repeat protein TolB [Geomonas paludis]|uniref:Tol-Pal system beta propeller repeat protein TolB n=1 Tax=Geomonas paludis TaxID=2740185 RepID=UPI0035306FC0
MLRVFLCLLILALLAVPAVPESTAGDNGEEVPIDVTAPGQRLLRTVVAKPLSDGKEEPACAKELGDLLSFDLSFAGPFEPAADPQQVRRRGIAPGLFDFAPLEAAAVDFLVLSGYTVAGSTLTVELRLYHVPSRSLKVAKRFTATVKELRQIGHLFSDEILLAVTGKRGPFSGGITLVTRKGGAKELALMDYDGHNMRPLTGNGSLNLHPDCAAGGAEIVYTSYKNGGPDLYRREIYQGSEARLTRSAGGNITPAFSPDGRRIAFSSSRDGNAEIYLMNRDGTGLRRLTSNRAIDVSPCWSPDGREIAFVSDRLGKPQIFIMGADGQNVRRLTTSGPYNVNPSWSPLGDRIVYSGQVEGTFQLFSIMPDGRDNVRLTAVGRNENPRWSPDGRFVVFNSSRAGGDGIYLMRADGSAQIRVSSGAGSDAEPVWAAAR